jgi:hypothetical protein
VIERLDTPASVDVQEAEYVRLLGYPRGFVLEGRALELADWARNWYRAHGRPWVYAHEFDEVEAGGHAARVAGVSFNSPQLAKTLRDAGAHSAIAVAVGAGGELEAEAHERWLDGKPDEYFFLEVYGSAVVEYLVTLTGARLCAWADGRGEAILPHYSPGYPDWDVSEQPRLLDVLRSSSTSHGHTLPLEVLDSGMLRPKKSLLALFGVTTHVDRVRRLAELVPCEHCSFAPCQYRRAPYRRSPLTASPELSGLAADSDGPSDADATAEGHRTSARVTSPLSANATYSVNERALRRWVDERLTVSRSGDGSIDATFRFDGTTCTNMGRPMAFHYRVRLGPASSGYLIEDETCAPVAGDEGHKLMCSYLDNADRLMTAIETERALLGRPLNEVLTWGRSPVSAGCYCEPESRSHKWGLVLETIHFALARGLAPSDVSVKETAS